jgi:uncharacterized membrane protein
MTDLGAYVLDWVHLVVRWGHLIAAIGWVGTSFYFISLDLGLVPSASPAVLGEAWEIHGGGFYKIEKFRVAPPHLPASLRWFKWEAYLTWLTGFVLLVLLYYVDPYSFLIDPRVAPLEPWQAVAASVALLALGWVVYDRLAAVLEARARARTVAVIALVVAVVLVASALFGSRAAYVHVGATLGTWMAANVLFVIIPGHRELVRAKEQGREPDPIWGLRGKQRSVDNNYLTLPVLFAMISQHFPFTYGNAYAPGVLLGLMAAGATAQHFLNLRHQGRPNYWILAAAGALALGVAVAIAPVAPSGPPLTEADRAALMPTIAARCQPCHSRTPTMPGIAAAPKGVVLETPDQVRANARRIYEQVALTRNMPLGDQTHMTDAERDLIARWFRSGALLP